MHLTRSERWILSNQYRLLEVMHAEDADHYRKVREALESGDTALIASYSAFIRVVHPPLSDEDRSLVARILSLYNALQTSYNAMEDKTGIEPEDLQLPGFDAESEGGFGEHARFLIEGEKSFAELDQRDGLVSPGPSLPMYRRMLEAWRLYGDVTTLSKIQILYIVEAGTEPTHD
jgi:uncharacterized protein YfbU (UPF0304 family)